MNEGDTPEDQAKNESLVPKWTYALRELNFAGYLAVLMAFLIYILTPLAIIALFGVRIANLIPFWIAGAMSLLFFAVLLLSPYLDTFDFEEMSSDDEKFSLFGHPWLMLGQSLLTAIMGLGVAFGSYVLLHWTATSLPLPLQDIIFGWYILFLPIMAVIMSVEGGQKWALKVWAGGFGPYAPPSMLAATIVAMTSFFGSLTFVLQRHHLIPLHEISGARPTVDNISTFYLWHFLDSIPLLDVTKTLKWAEPMSYRDTATGVLVLCYKAAVIIPIIAMFVYFWKTTRVMRNSP